MGILWAPSGTARTDRLATKASLPHPVEDPPPSSNVPARTRSKRARSPSPRPLGPHQTRPLTPRLLSPDPKNADTAPDSCACACSQTAQSSGSTCTPSAEHAEGTAEEARKLSDSANVQTNGLGAEVADLQILGHSLSKRCHWLSSFLSWVESLNVEGELVHRDRPLGDASGVTGAIRSKAWPAETLEILNGWGC